MVPELINESGCPAHVVQFYDGDPCRLTTSVARYLADGLHGGEGIIAITTPRHREEFVRKLADEGLNPESAVQDGRMVFRDAEETLARFMVRGQPDWECFQATIEPVIGVLQARAANARVRAYGEMVDVLWNAGQSAAAARLEQFWNKLLRARGFSLFCAYQIDVFGREFHTSVLDSVLCAHTHLLPAEGGVDLERAVSQALRDVLGSRAEGLKSIMKANFRPSWAAIPKGEATVLWIRNNLPDYADEILARARGYYEAGNR